MEEHLDRLETDVFLVVDFLALLVLNEGAQGLLARPQHEVAQVGPSSCSILRGVDFSRGVHHLERQLPTKRHI